jgi:hypothetical protein
LTSPNSPTEPHFPLPRKEKRPWWAAALVGGFGAGVALAGAMGLSSMQARGSEPVPVRTSSASLPPGSISLDERLRNMETTLNTLVLEVGDLKARLPPRRP